MGSSVSNFIKENPDKTAGIFTALAGTAAGADPYAAMAAGGNIRGDIQNRNAMIAQQQAAQQQQQFENQMAMKNLGLERQSIESQRTLAALGMGYKVDPSGKLAKINTGISTEQALAQAEQMSKITGKKISPESIQRYVLETQAGLTPELEANRKLYTGLGSGFLGTGLFGAKDLKVKQNTNIPTGDGLFAKN